MNSGAYEVMKGRPWKAVNFDWDFSVGDNRLRRGIAIIDERQSFIRMLEYLKFKIYPFDQKDVKSTRNLSKTQFLEELKEFKRRCCEEPCGCLLVTVSSHGVILPQDEKKDGQTDGTKTQDGQRDKVKTYEDYVLTHPEPDKNGFSKDFKDERVSVREIVEIFRDSESESNKLKGIPKIFFIQACRDDSKQIAGNPGVDVGVQIIVEEDSVSGTSVEFPPTPPENQTTNPPPGIDESKHKSENPGSDEGVQLLVGEEKSEPGISVELKPIPPESQIVYSPPCIDDSVIVFSTPFGYAAGFNSRRGSHVWRDLSTKFKEFKDAGRPVNLLDLLRETNWKLSQSENTIDGNGKVVVYKPLLSICHTLTRHIVF